MSHPARSSQLVRSLPGDQSVQEREVPLRFVDLCAAPLIRWIAVLLITGLLLAAVPGCAGEYHQVPHDCAEYHYCPPGPLPYATYCGCLTPHAAPLKVTVTPLAR